MPQPLCVFELATANANSAHTSIVDRSTASNSENSAMLSSFNEPIEQLPNCVDCIRRKIMQWCSGMPHESWLLSRQTKFFVSVLFGFFISLCIVAVWVSIWIVFILFNLLPNLCAVFRCIAWNSNDLHEMQFQSALFLSRWIAWDCDIKHDGFSPNTYDNVIASRSITLRASLFSLSRRWFVKCSDSASMTIIYVNLSFGKYHFVSHSNGANTSATRRRRNFRWNGEKPFQMKINDFLVRQRKTIRHFRISSQFFDRLRRGFWALLHPPEKLNCFSAVALMSCRKRAFPFPWIRVQNHVARNHFIAKQLTKCLTKCIFQKFRFRFYSICLYTHSHCFCLLCVDKLRWFRCGQFMFDKLIALQGRNSYLMPLSRTHTTRFDSIWHDTTFRIVLDIFR